MALALRRASASLLARLPAFREATEVPAIQSALSAADCWRGGWLGFPFTTSAAQEAGGGGGEPKPAAPEAAPADAAAAGAGGAAQQGQGQEQVAQQQGQEKELSIEELRQALEYTIDELEGEKKKSEDLKEKLLRTLADMENLRDRTTRAAAEAKQYAGLVKSLLEVADNLERAAGSVPSAEVEGEGNPERAVTLLRSLREGVLMTEGILLKILAREGVVRYDPLGEAFDPNLHMALFEVPDATKEPGTVAIVIKARPQKGYMLHERAIRAAEVGVARATEDD
eukprot:scaffold5.g968.t1